MSLIDDVSDLGLKRPCLLNDEKFLRFRDRRLRRLIHRTDGIQSLAIAERFLRGGAVFGYGERVVQYSLVLDRKQKSFLFRGRYIRFSEYRWDLCSRKAGN